MINSFKLKNFRSYAEEADLTFEAQPSELNSGAVKAVALNGGPASAPEQSALFAMTLFRTVAE